MGQIPMEIFRQPGSRLGGSEQIDPIFGRPVKAA
jgi:hypothetical protein